MEQADRFRYRIRFAKEGALRFIGHLDLLRLLEQACRRAGLLFAFRGRFRPHPRLRLALPLPLSHEGSEEILEFELVSWLNIEELLVRLGRQLPEGITLSSAEALRPTDRTVISDVEYLVSGWARPVPLEEAVSRFMSQPQAWVERRGPRTSRRVDAREYCLGLEARGGELWMKLRISNRGSVRPEEVLEAMALPARSPEQPLRIRRVKVTISSDVAR